MELLGRCVGQASARCCSTRSPFLFVLTHRRLRARVRAFLVGRRCGVGVKAFSIGFGPELSAGTTGTARAGSSPPIPLGGYVKFVGDMNGASVPDDGRARRA